ncbi:hypothetical protein BEK75_09830 [Enterococcus faecium]|nr:hypothetical protein BEK75_09830 [Enterococcus faecium]
MRDLFNWWKKAFFTYIKESFLKECLLYRDKPFLFLWALCQMMLVKRNLRIIWTEQKEENLFLFCLFG